MFIEDLKASIAPKNLLNHEFYQLWNVGELDKEVIADYAKQYYTHVEAFPRYISLIHSQCSVLEDRQVLLENLIEEERGSENHPKLWRDFAFSLGVNKDSLDNCVQYAKTKHLVDRFFDLCKESYASGLGALYAYEHQTPAVSESKIKGLKDFYNITSKEALKFFEVHQGVDEWHSEEVASLINKLSDEEKKEAASAASEAADLLWGFLDGMMEAHNLNCAKA
jgi:pyrroloquinoline-quinone synthase